MFYHYICFYHKLHNLNQTSNYKPVIQQIYETPVIDTDKNQKDIHICWLHHLIPTIYVHSSSLHGCMFNHQSALFLYFLQVLGFTKSIFRFQRLVEFVLFYKMLKCVTSDEGVRTMLTLYELFFASFVHTWHKFWSYFSY